MTSSMGNDVWCSLWQVDRKTWLEHAPKFSDYNYRQSWEFGTACALRVGARAEHVAIGQKERQILSLADVRVRKLPVIGGGIAYINGGPLVYKEGRQDSNQGDLHSAVIGNLVEEYVVRRKFSLRISPPIICDSLETNWARKLLDFGFMEIPKKKGTVILDIRPDEAEIRRSFHQKWRNCLSKSEKTGMSLRISTDASVFSDFIPLFNELVEEKHFSVDLDSNFYANVQKAASEKDKFIVILAQYDGKPVAGHVSSMLGDTCVYLLGASNGVGRATNAAYLLQWKAIQLGKAAGCKWYDLGGIDSLANQGVYTFKKRMGGQEIIIPGPFQLNPPGVRAFFAEFSEKIYVKLRRRLIRL
jgi:hypothetical protein